jgi:hypothetical protein
MGYTESSHILENFVSRYGEINWHPFDRSDGQETLLRTKLRKKHLFAYLLLTNSAMPYSGLSVGSMASAAASSYEVGVFVPDRVDRLNGSSSSSFYRCGHSSGDRRRVLQGVPVPASRAAGSRFQ